MQARTANSQTSKIFLPDINAEYPIVKSASGVWLEDLAGEKYLDAMSGGSMAMTLGYGRKDIITAARVQAEHLAYIHNERLTNPIQEQLAQEILDVAPTGHTHVRFVTGGSEANEMAVQLARMYHVERGEPNRWRVISPAQAYHGATMMALSMTARPALYSPYEPYLSSQVHVPPSTWHFDSTGQAALAELDRVIEEVGAESISLFFCEPISAAALPGYSPPKLFWEGLAERQKEYGFLIGFDEVVTGVGRTGSWFVGNDTPLVPDLIATAKGLGAGYAAIGAVLCHEKIFEAVRTGEGKTMLGHTWDGAPLPCAVGRAVINVIREEGILSRIQDRGAKLKTKLSDALADVPFVKEVCGKGYLLGVHYVDPRDGKSFLPAELKFAKRVDKAAMSRRLVTLSTQPTKDGFAGDSTLFAPAFTASNEELDEMVARFLDVIYQVSDETLKELDQYG